MTFTFTSYTLDNFVAPGLSSIDSCQAEYIQEGKYLASFLLGSLFVGKLDQKNYSFVINYLIRIDQAISEYREGRTSLMTLVNDKNICPSIYFQCAHHFQSCIALLYQALCIGRRHDRFLTGVDKPFFKDDDSSPLHRLNKVYNAWRHAESRIEHGKLPSSGHLPLLLTKEGFEVEKDDSGTDKSKLSFGELREILAEAAELAKFLAEDVFKREDAPGHNILPVRREDA